MKALREARELTAEELGTLCQVSGNVIWRYETGDRQPRPEVLERLAKVLRTTPTYLHPADEEEVA